MTYNTRKSISVIFCGLLFLGGCSTPNADDNILDGGFEVTIYSSNEELATKVGYEESGSALSLYWHSDDQISIFESSERAIPSTFKVEDMESATASSANFVGRLYSVEQGDEIYAIYPKRDDVKCDPTATLIEMSIQYQSGEKIGVESAVMSARTTYQGLTATTLNFVNHLAMVRFTLSLPSDFEGTPSKFIVSSPDLISEGNLDITTGEWGELRNGYIQEVELDGVEIKDSKISVAALVIPSTLSKLLLTIESATTNGEVNIYDIYKTASHTFEPNKAYDWSVSGELTKQDIIRYKKSYILDDAYRDPYIYLYDNTYYMTYTSGGLKMPVWQSDNLDQGWTLISEEYSFDDLSFFSDVYANSSTPDDIKTWAPEIHRVGDEWWVTHTSNEQRGAIITSNSVTFDQITEPAIADFGHNHDPSIFQDDNGDIWLVAFCAKITKLKPDLSGYDSEELTLSFNQLSGNPPMGHEGSQIMKIGNKYVWFATGWSRKELQQGTYNLYYATADNVEGPYGDRHFAGRCLGHGTVFQDYKGNWWCTAFSNGTYVDPTEIDVTVPVDATSSFSMNSSGATLVPMSVEIVDDDIVINALDPYYTYPGDEELQDFSAEM